MKNVIRNSLGEIAISKEVIATLAGNAAMECYGLVGIASRKMSDGLTELLGRENFGKGVEVKMNEDELSVNLYIIVQYVQRLMKLPIM